MSTPLKRYEDDLHHGRIVHDTAQQQAVKALQNVYEQVVNTPAQSASHALSWLPWRRSAPSPIKGLYLWGGVGRGKTYLMDVFYEQLPIKHKQRTHFHRFMQQVHHELEHCKGEKNPLITVANRIADNATVLCFDEFFVEDITNAMILGRLFQQLFARGVVLITTSNVEPDQLYKDGLQRSQFLPAIDLLYQYTQVLNVDAGVDYRLQKPATIGSCYSPLNESTHQQLLQGFKALCPYTSTVQEAVTLSVQGRPIHCIRHCDDVAWFSFEALCSGPRSPNDYIELAERFSALIIEGIPRFMADCLASDDQARRFIHLIDELYDRKLSLILSAEVPIEQLYQTGKLQYAFARTQSRLQEMRSESYQKYFTQNRATPALAI